MSAPAGSDTFVRLNYETPPTPNQPPPARQRLAKLEILLTISTDAIQNYNLLPHSNQFEAEILLQTNELQQLSPATTSLFCLRPLQSSAELDYT